MRMPPHMQARGDVRRLKQAITTTVAAAGGLWPSGNGNGAGHGNGSSGGGGGSGYSSSGESDAATAVEQAARRLEALRGMLEERREQDQVGAAINLFTVSRHIESTPLLQGLAQRWVDGGAHLCRMSLLIFPRRPSSSRSSTCNHLLTGFRLAISFTLQRLLGVLNNALNAAAVPNILAGEHGCTDTPDDATDGFGERPIDRG